MTSITSLTAMCIFASGISILWSMCKKKDGHIGETKFLTIARDIVKTPGAIATSEVSIKTGVVPASVEDMLPNLDLEVCYDKTDWKDKGVQARKRLTYKYELLIPDEIPLDMITNL